MKTNHDNLAEQKLEKPSHIQDENLAWDMAHAAKPHIESAQLSMKQGNFAETAGHLVMAEVSSRQAAEGFIDEQQVKLDELRHQVGATDKGTESYEKATNFETFETKVTHTKEALAERYSVPAEDFNLVSYETEDGETKQTVMYTGLQGIDLGNPKKEFDKKRSYNSLMADDSHIIEIDGNKVDSRTLTESAYRAFINQEIAKDSEGPLPDSQSLDIWTGTWLPGEKAYGDDARCGDVREGRPSVHWVYRGRDAQHVRFRPAVEITED